MHTAVAQITQDTEHNAQSLALRAVPDLPATVDSLNLIEREILLSLDNQTEDELLKIRQQSKLAGWFAWRIEVAVDAQFVSRAKNMRGRNGSVALGTGRTAAVRKRAKQIGVTPNTIFKNQAIFNLIQEAEGNLNNASLLQLLDEKGFYVAALSARKSVDALLLFAEKKSLGKRFRVSDAFRLLISEGLTNKIASSNAIASIRSAPRKKRYDYLKKLRSILEECPDTDMLGRLCLQDCLDDVRDEIGEMFDTDVEVAIKKTWSIACQTEQQLADASGFPLNDIRRIIYHLDEYFIEIPTTNPKRWHKVGEPLPPELRNDK